MPPVPANPGCSTDRSCRKGLRIGTSSTPARPRTTSTESASCRSSRRSRRRAHRRPRAATEWRVRTGDAAADEPRSRPESAPAPCHEPGDDREDRTGTVPVSIVARAAKAVATAAGRVAATGRRAVTEAADPPAPALHPAARARPSDQAQAPPPTKQRRGDVLVAIPGGQRPVAEFALQGMAAVRQRLREDNARSKAKTSRRCPKPRC